MSKTTQQVPDEIDNFLINEASKSLLKHLDQRDAYDRMQAAMKDPQMAHEIRTWSKASNKRAFRASERLQKYLNMKGEN